MRQPELPHVNLSYNLFLLAEIVQDVFVSHYFAENRCHLNVLPL